MFEAPVFTHSFLQNHGKEKNVLRQWLSFLVACLFFLSQGDEPFIVCLLLLLLLALLQLLEVLSPWWCGIHASHGAVWEEQQVFLLLFSSKFAMKWRFRPQRVST